MNCDDPDLIAVVQLAEERMRQALIDRAAVEGLTPAEIQRAITIESNRQADREAEAANRERPR